MEALSRLGKDSRAIWVASIFITLLFIAIECAPIFVKLISTRSPYDYLLYDLEQDVEIPILEKTKIARMKLKRKLDFDKNTGEHRKTAAITAENEIADAILRQKVEELKKNPLPWDLSILRKGILGN